MMDKQRITALLMIIALLLTAVCAQAEAPAEDPVTEAALKGYQLLFIYDVIEAEDGIYVEGCFGNRAVDEATDELFEEGFDDLNGVILRLADDCVLLFPEDTRENLPLGGPGELVLWYLRSISAWCTDRTFHAYYTLDERCMLTRLEYYGDMYD